MGYTQGMSINVLIAWSPVQIQVFRREILRESTSAFSAHWTFENGQGVSSRAVESWESLSRPKRPGYFIRCQMSAAFRHLAAHKNNKHLWHILPPNPSE